ncbi:MAG: alpha/beta family hydrolase [Xenococcaceae cyanobacterium]
MNRKNIEAIYPLVPMQQALLLHSLKQEKSRLGFLHVRCTLHGNLNIAMFKRSWERVVSRHTTLRKSVHWEDLDKPLQVVYRQVSLPWEYQDWQTAALTEQQARLTAFLRADRSRGFDFTQAPVMRLTLIRTAENTYQFIWSCHYLLLDGWSGTIVLKEVFNFYEVFCQGQDLDLGQARSYQDYINWLKQQDVTKAEVFWRQALRGFVMPTPLPIERVSDNGSRQQKGTDEQHSELTVAMTATLQSFINEHRLTLNTLVQGAWALLLSSYSGEEDVLFGATVSGRPAALAGVDTIVGLFINNLPIRVRLSPAQPVLPWLQKLQKQQFSLSQYEHIPLMQIQDWSEVPGHLRLFKSLLVVGNFPWLGSSQKQNRSLEVRDLQSGIVTTYPLTLVVKPGPALGLYISYDLQCFDSDLIARILRQFQSLLESFAKNSEGSLDHMLRLIKAEQYQPLTPNGKIDRCAFPAPNSTRQEPGTTFMAPCDKLESQLIQIWEQVLGVQPIGVRDNFFDLGGHSLLAVQLFTEIEKAFNKNLPLAALFQAPTVEQLANILRPEGWSSPWYSLVPIQPGGSKPTLFAIHHLGPGLSWYRTLARHLGSEQPIYGLNYGIAAKTRSSKQTPPSRIEDLAAHYIKEMRNLQPQGPYFLGGISFGGRVAFEMAHQLVVQGQKVALLALFDSWGPGTYKPLPIREWIATILSRILRLGFAYVLKSIKNKVKIWLTKPEITDLHRYGKYVSQVYPFRLILFRSIDYTHANIGSVGLLHKFDPKLGWGELATGELEIHDIPGGHLSMLEEPQVGVVAEKLRTCIERTQS